jgi:hypothetical protein
MNLDDVILNTSYHTERPSDAKEGDMCYIEGNIHIFIGGDWGIISGVAVGVAGDRTIDDIINDIQRKAVNEVQRKRNSAGWSNADQAVMNLILPDEDEVTGE